MWWSADQHKADFLDLANLQTKMVDLPIEPNLPTQQKTWIQNWPDKGGFLDSTFLRIWPQKMIEKKLIHCETPDLL